MNRNKTTKRALAVLLSASLALTPAYTVFATEVSESEAADSSTAEETLVFQQEDPATIEVAPDELTTEEVSEEIPTEEKDPEEQTRVIIVMEGDSVIDQGFDVDDIADNHKAVKASEKLEAAQDAEVEKISEEALDGEELEVNYSFTLLSNAVSADVAYKDIEEIEKVDGVVAVYVAQQYDPMDDVADPETVTAGDMVGGYSAWATGYTGAGTRIAVVDTGIDLDHPSFDSGAYLAHLEETAEEAGKTVADYNLMSEEEIASVLPQLNATRRNADITPEKLYLNDKIPFAFNYVDKNLDITHDNDDEGDHGTHVSGIATANVYVPNASSETGYAKQESGVVGVAPDAQLITMKVFGTKGGAYTDDYMAAIEDCLLLNVDVVNLSLGSSSAGYTTDGESYINETLAKLEGTGTVVSISAGNSGRLTDDSTYGVNLSGDVNQDTVGSPGSYTNAFTVASAVNSGFTGNYFTFNENPVWFTPGNESKGPDFHTLDTSADLSGTEYPFVLLNSTGAATDYEGIDVTDKIVFVKRGGLTFAEKHMNAEAAGAKGVFIYNNTAGTLSMTLQGSEATIPVAAIKLSEAEAIAAGATEVSENVYEGTIVIYDKVKTNYEADDAYTMSDFSSYGVPSSLDLKPEITAPGSNIYSTVDHGLYASKNGTSMAAPSIAGQGALLAQYIKENHLAEDNDISVRSLSQSLIMSTATPLHEKNDENAPVVSPRSQGAGLANVSDAIASNAYILVGDKEGNDGKVKVTLGDDPERTGSYNFDFDVYNMSENPQYYVLDATVLTEQLYGEEGLTYFMGTSHELAPAVSLSASDTSLVYDLNEDGRINAKDRKAFLQVVNGTKTLAKVSENEDYYDANKDGVLNTKDVYAFARQLKGGKAVYDFGLEVVEVKDSTKINVAINLSEEDRAYLAGFENGIYVDGYIYLKGNVDLSVPFLAFYGSWMDPSMYEPYDCQRAYVDKEYAATAQTYCGIAKTNFLSVFYDGADDPDDEMFYYSNRFAMDSAYIPDRNAMNNENGTKLGSQYYTLIRNANRVIVTITNAETGEVYFRDMKTENYAEFIHLGKWYNTLESMKLDWAGTDAEGKPLPEGTKVNVTLQAIPSYYDNVEDETTLTGKGLFLTTPLVIDNSAPELTATKKNADGTVTISFADNRYTAAVLVLNDKRNKVLSRYAVNQTEAGAEQTLDITIPEGSFTIALYDYAGNRTLYTVTKSTKKTADAATETNAEEPTETADVADATQEEEKKADAVEPEKVEDVTDEEDN